MKLRGDRFGGVIFDIQQHRKGEATLTPGDSERAVQREKLIHVVSTLITMIEEIDDLEFHTFNSQEARSARMAARAAGYVRCEELTHDQWGQRKTDCTECTPLPRPPFPSGEQASLTSSLANLSDPAVISPRQTNPWIGEPPAPSPMPHVITDIMTPVPDREPPMHAILCACENPNCNSDNTYPKPCYACGGLVVKK